MRHRRDLATLDWTLTGHTPCSWELGRSMETGLALAPEVAAVPARVPGSVQAALRAAGVLPDWERGLDSRACEWVEHREWVFRAELPEAWAGTSGEKILRCAGLDGFGHVLVDGQPAGLFGNAFLPHAFDLTDALAGGDRQLELVFEPRHPRWLGQLTRSSQLPVTKPRFNYTWDWQERLVQIGVWGPISLEIADGPAIVSLDAWTDYDAGSRRGTLHWRTALDAPEAAARVRLTIEDAAGEAVYRDEGRPTESWLRASGLDVAPWWPSGLGEPVLYRVRAQLVADDGTVLDTADRRVGFREITWRACDGAPDEADPWICVVNGRPVFLRGVNWTPVRGNFADVTDEMVRDRVATYRELNMNLLRVWGGAVLESTCFFEACDEMGLLVWQEFPLSSSGLDNSPPYDAATTATLERIAESYVERRRHHPSLAIWCGGNELQTADSDRQKEGIGRPWDASHPALAAMKTVVEREDPTRRYLPTSSTGPRFTADADAFGRGLHWDVHGPWRPPGDTPEAAQAYWDRDDALFRSEMGCPGAMDAAGIETYAGGRPTTPGTLDNPLFRRVSWWIDWPIFVEEHGREPAGLAEYVDWSQQRQATYLAMAARACVGRFPRCGGLLFWMGHDAFPCPVNTAILDFEGRPKPAARAVGEIFAGMDEAGA